MIKVILFTLAVGSVQCPETIIENRTDEWNTQDMQTLVNAKKRCGEIYPDSPCLKKLIKKDSQTYNAICGK